MFLVYLQSLCVSHGTKWWITNGKQVTRVIFLKFYCTSSLRFDRDFIAIYYHTIIKCLQCLQNECRLRMRCIEYEGNGQSSIHASDKNVKGTTVSKKMNWSMSVYEIIPANKYSLHPSGLGPMVSWKHVRWFMCTVLLKNAFSYIVKIVTKLSWIHCFIQCVQPCNKTD